jgi:hypothetical protein
MKNKKQQKSTECEVFQKHFNHSGRFQHKVEVPKKHKKEKHKDKNFSKEAY